MGNHRKVPGMTRDHISNLNLVKVVKGRNSRKDFDAEKLENLKASIFKHGLLQPVLGRKVHDPETGTEFELTDGERRFRAIQQLHAEGHDQIKLKYVTNIGDARKAEVQMVVANIQREAFSPVEEANAVARFAQYGWTSTEIANELSKSVTWVEDRITIFNSSSEVKDALNRKLPQDVAIDLAKNVPEKSQGDVLQAALAEVDGNVKKVRKAVAKKTGRKIRPGKKDMGRVMEQLEKRWSETHHTFNMAEMVAALMYGAGDLSEEEFYDEINL